MQLKQFFLFVYVTRGRTLTFGVIVGVDQHFSLPICVRVQVCSTLTKMSGGGGNFTAPEGIKRVS